MMVILSLSFVSAIESGAPYFVYEVPKCYVDAFVRIDGETNVFDDNYSFDGCSKIPCEQCGSAEELWKCQCDQGKSMNITLNTGSNVKNIYDIVIQYYISEPISNDYNLTQDEITILNDNIKRVENFNNLELIPPTPPRKPFKMPVIKNTGMLIIIFGVILVVVLIGLVFLFKWIMKDQYEESKTDNQKILDIINRNRSK